MTPRAAKVAATMRPVLLAALVACAPPGTGGAGTTTASATTTATTDAPTSSGTTDACVGSGECDSEGICVADYDPSPDPADPGARGPAACAGPDACIPALDLGRWCFDHQGCCESLRCRTADGVCEPGDLGQTGGESSTGVATDATTGVATDATDTTGTTTDTTTSGTSTGTGTDG